MKVAPYTALLAAEKAKNAPAPAATVMALRDNAHHCKDILYDDERHTPDGAHAHRGDESETIGQVYPNTPNLISRPYVDNRVSIWNTSGGGVWHLEGPTQDPRGLSFASGGQWASVPLTDSTRPDKSLTMFGQGSTVVGSGYLVASAVPTGGTMQFGLVNGGDNNENQKQFPVGVRADIPAVVLTTLWQRFWFVADTRRAQFQSSIRFCVQCSSDIEPVGTSVFANLFDLRPGRVLDYPVPSYVNALDINWGDWGRAAPLAAGSPPPFDHDISIANAIRLPAR